MYHHDPDTKDLAHHTTSDTSVLIKYVVRKWRATLRSLTSSWRTSLVQLPVAMNPLPSIAINSCTQWRFASFIYSRLEHTLRDTHNNKLCTMKRDAERDSVSPPPIRRKLESTTTSRFADHLHLYLNLNTTCRKGCCWLLYPGLEEKS